MHTALLKRLISIGEWLKTKSVFMVLVTHWMHLIVRWSFLSDNDEDDKDNQSLNNNKCNSFIFIRLFTLLSSLGNSIMLLMCRETCGR